MSTTRERLSGVARRLLSDAVGRAWDAGVRLGMTHAGSARAQRFGHFGKGSTLAFPPGVVHGEHRIHVGEDTAIGGHATLSAGMPAPLDDRRDPLLVIGDRCVLGRGIAIVAHEHIEIGDDTWTGPNVYITDQNHGYEDLSEPIGTQMWRNAPVSIGPACWIGTGAVILPGAKIGRHVLIAAGAVVSGAVPDHCVVAGVPARIVRRHVPERGWVRTAPDGTPLPEPSEVSEDVDPRELQR